MDEKTQALLDFYSRENKNDFYNAYLYMKYLYQFESLVMQGMGLPVNPGIEKIDPAMEDMLRANLGIVSEAFGSPETDIYHAKVVPLRNARKLVSVDIDVHLEVPETIVPFRLARSILLKDHDSIAIGACPCRLAQAECTCMAPPMEACMFIGDPHASFIAEHNPRFRKVLQDEAAHILEDCHNKGFVHCAYFKKDMGNRMFAICNCCSCCCGGIKIHNLLQGIRAAGGGSMKVSHVTPSGYVAEVSEECTGCQECMEPCPFDAIGFDQDGNRAVIDFDRCMGCGVCEGVCPVQAITLKAAPSKGGILDLDELRKIHP